MSDAGLRQRFTARAACIIRVVLSALSADCLTGDNDSALDHYPFGFVRAWIGSEVEPLRTAMILIGKRWFLYVAADLLVPRNYPKAIEKR